MSARPGTKSSLKLAAGCAGLCLLAFVVTVTYVRKWSPIGEQRVRTFTPGEERIADARLRIAARQAAVLRLANVE